MEDSKFFELREKLIEQLHQFVSECKSLDLDEEDEIENILRDMWDSAI